jgi:hypothetical protein
MQVSALMSDVSFDRLTVSIGSTGSLWQALRLLWEFLTTQILPLSGGAPPEAASLVTGRYCVDINIFGQCSEGEKAAVSGFKASVNGCGGAGSLKFKETYYNANWRWACDIHDECYTKCATAKETCDANIQTDIAQACRTAFPSDLYTVERRFCYGFASLYKDAVSHFGMYFWIMGQKEGCRCCTDCGLEQKECGTQCCQPGEMCCNSRCIRQEQCCADNFIYCAGLCIDPRHRQCCRNAAGEFICGTHQSCCSNGTCCDAGSTCCEKNGVRSCVPLSNQNCNFQCTECGSLQHCCPSAWGSSFGCCLSTEKCDPHDGCVRMF